MTGDALERIRASLEDDPRIVVAYLFGSEARGDASAGSDVDVAVLWDDLGHDALRRRAKLIETLSRAAGKTVDAVILNEAPPALAGRILRDGRVLVCRDDAARVRFEIRAMQRDLDTRAMRELFDRTLASAIRQGRFYG